MTAVVALRCALEEDLSDLLRELRSRGVPCYVSEESGQQLLWVPDERLVPVVQQWYRELPVTIEQSATTAPAGPALRQRLPGSVQALLRQQPVTLITLLLSALVALLTLLGSERSLLYWLTFTAVEERGEYLWLHTLADTLGGGQWWRLFTPILIHFGLLHLVMNSLWFWELGRRIEWRQGSLQLLPLILLLALLSNLAQYLFAEPGIFGGLSGVLYGLLGHCWLFNRLAPTPLYRLPPGTVGLMIGWLLFCLTGITESIGLGAIANAAHVGGLLAGVVTGTLGGLLARRRALF